MSTPQDPGQPGEPQNPYGSPPPPPSGDQPGGIPPAAPVYGTEPTTPPPAEPSAPSAPSYGEAPPPPPPAQPAQPGYPQPGYGQPAYPVPQYGGPQPTDEPGKGMAIAALVISFFGCVLIGALVAIPLAIVVLLRSRDGRNHGKGLAISAIVISLLTLALPVIGLVAGVSYLNGLTDVNDLKQGDCITASGLSDDSAKSVTDIKTVECSEPHDGEVLAVVTLTEDQATDYATTPVVEICGPAVEAAGKAGVLSDTVVYTALTVADPQGGDKAACVAYSTDGSDLDGTLGA